MQGHAVGNMLTGSGGCSNEAVTPPSAPASAPATQPCEFEWKQFIEWSVLRFVSLCHYMINFCVIVSLCHYMFN